MPPGGRSGRECGGGCVAGLPYPWPDGRARPPQLDRKGGYLRVGAQPRGQLPPQPFRGHLRSQWVFEASDFPANARHVIFKPQLSFRFRV